MAKAKKKKTPVKKVAAKKPTAKKTVAKKTAVKKSPAKKVSAKKVAPKKASSKKASSPAPVLPKAKKIALVDLSDFVTPLDDRLIVQLKEMERKTAGGLFLPDTVSDVSGNLEGVVVAVGRGHRDNKGRMRPMDVQRGDRIVFAEYAGHKIQLKNEELIILRESEVMGVLS